MYVCSDATSEQFGKIRHSYELLTDSDEGVEKGTKTIILSFGTHENYELVFKEIAIPSDSCEALEEAEERVFKAALEKIIQLTFDSINQGNR